MSTTQDQAPSRDTTSGSAPAASPWWRREWFVMVVLAVLAVVVRLANVRSSGGLRVTMGYDDGVYFTAVNALLHGMVPYQDFVLVHPPGILVLAAGPVWIAHLVGLGDSDTLVAIRLLFVGVGALNTVLTYVAGRHLSRSAGVVAASLYAVWLPMVREERTLRLEAVVALGLLAALALIPPVSNRPLGSARMTTGWWRPVVAGLVGALAASTKLWALVPIGVVVLALLVARRWRWALLYVGTGILGMAAIIGPFLVAAGPTMWDRIVSDQLSRPRTELSLDNRLSGMLDGGLPIDGRTVLGPDDHATIVAATLCVALLSVVVAVKLPVARLWVALLVVQGLVLLAVPVFYTGYASFVGPAGVLVAGAGFHLAWHSRAAVGRRGGRQVLAGAVVVVVAGLGWAAATTDAGWAVRPRIQRLVAEAHCVATDDPIMLALTDTLTANLERGCRIETDFTGAVLGMERPTSGQFGGTGLRLNSPEFQQFALDYFDSGNVVIIRRADDDGLTPASWAILNRRAVIRLGGTWIYLDRPAPDGTDEHEPP